MNCFIRGPNLFRSNLKPNKLHS